MLTKAAPSEAHVPNQPGLLILASQQVNCAIPCLLNLPGPGGRSLLDDMQMMCEGGRDLLQSHFPAGDFSAGRFHLLIFILCH